MLEGRNVPRFFLFPFVLVYEGKGKMRAATVSSRCTTDVYAGILQRARLSVVSTRDCFCQVVEENPLFIARYSDVSVTSFDYEHEPLFTKKGHFVG